MKYLVMFTAMVLACCLCCGFIPSEEDMDIYENTVRLHVIANSDSEHDQSVKLLVRDRVLAELNVLLAEVQTQEEATAIIESNLDRLRAVCNETLEAIGEEANAELYFKQEKYPTRHYENISLPAGVYQSLQIKLGEADGQNWWCVLFPTLCTSAAKTEEALVKTGFTSDQIGVLTSGDRPKYKMKFKIMEFFGENFSE
jgi:stage II sporulation protein R